MTTVFKSRHTPKAKGYEIDFQLGESVKYQLLNGVIINVVIVSERMTHDQCKTFGYEGIFSDTGEIGFADGERIISWEGKVR
jgi:hypothetical protein